MVENVLRRLGGVAHLAAFIRAGVSADAVQRAARAGRLIRVRHGVYALLDADEQVVRAARVGGRLAGASAAARLGLWAVPRHGLVVSVHRTARLLDPDSGAPMRERPDVRVLWSASTETRRYGLVDPTTALLQVARMERPEYAQAVWDSALRRSLLTRPELVGLAERLPQRCREVALVVDGRMESGTESVLRSLLRAEGIRARPQQRIPFTDLERVDFVIGDRLVVEVDSEAYHGSQEHRRRDRRRDALLACLGFIVLRFDYWQIIDEPDTVVAAVRAYVDAGLHLARATAR